MSFVALVLLALGLAMDAMAVSGTRGFAARRIRVRDAALVALFFGGFQAAMPALGWAVGATFASQISSWGHWFVFVVLGGIGAKMLHEARAPSEPQPAGELATANVFDLEVLALLAVATSIDALAAGVALAVAHASIVPACAVIGVVTGVLSFGGVYAGHHFGRLLGKRLEVVGGLVLIALAAKALVDHYR